MSASAKPSFPSEIFRGVIENDALRAEINLLRLEIAALRKEISPARSSAILVGSIVLREMEALRMARGHQQCLRQKTPEGNESVHH